MVDKNYLHVIKMIQSIGYNVIYIDETFFVVSEFIPASDQIDCHTLTGIDCTDIIKTNVGVIIKDQSLNTRITEMINSLIKTVTETQKFSKETQWRWFFSTK